MINEDGKSHHHIFAIVVIGAIVLTSLFFVGREIADFVFSQEIAAKENAIQIPNGLNKTTPEVFIPTPKVKEIYPADGTQDVFLDMEQPITVKFQSPIRGHFIHFKLAPLESPDKPVSLAYENNPEKTEFRLLPKETLKLGVTYFLSISSEKTENIGTDLRVLLSETTFVTLPPSPQDWGTGADRLALARQYTQAKKSEGRYIDINIEKQVMTLFENGKFVANYLVSSGLPGLDTPTGEFTIHNKAPRPWSKQYSLFMPNWMAITADGKYGIHELPEWPGGYKEGANHLGRKASHGCVRLGEGSANNVYGWADIGTQVVIY